MEHDMIEEKKVKKIFKELYFDDFDDPSEDLVDSLYDLVPADVIANEMKKIKGIKEKKGKIYMVEKVNKRFESKK